MDPPWVLVMGRKILFFEKNHLTASLKHQFVNKAGATIQQFARGAKRVCIHEHDKACVPMLADEAKTIKERAYFPRMYTVLAIRSFVAQAKLWPPAKLWPSCTTYTRREIRLRITFAGST